MNSTILPPARKTFASAMLAAGLLVASMAMDAAPSLVSSVPANMAPDVSPSASIVFTFSETMNPDPTVTLATFIDVQTFQQLAVSSVWSSANTLLTCTPLVPLAADHMIVWTVDGENPAGVAMPTAQGMFTTSSGATSTGCDPNATILSFTVSKGWMYGQTSDAAPMLDTNTPYCFLACMNLPCPRSATNVSLLVPNTGARPNMAVTPSPGHLNYLDCSYLNQTTYEAAYPYGNYTFTIQASTSNQAVTVNFPSTLTQPPAPHLTNYAAAQAINPALPFVLAWDPVAGGTTADLIYVEIYGTSFKTPQLGEAGGLNGTTTAVVIPANTLKPNQTYSGGVSFYHYELLTNGTSHVSLAYRNSTTGFNLQTKGASFDITLTNACSVDGKTFTFDIDCPAGSMVVEWSSDLVSGPWQTLCQTNSLGQRLRISDPRVATNPHLFYRVRQGPSCGVASGLRNPAYKRRQAPPQGSHIRRSFH